MFGRADEETDVLFGPQQRVEVLEPAVGLFGATGVDIVTDFNFADGDRVQLDAGTAYVVDQVGDDVLINMGGNNYMLLTGVQMSSLGAGWIFEG